MHRLTGELRRRNGHARNDLFILQTSTARRCPIDVTYDFNGDGKLDLGVTSNYYTPGSYGYYGWYPGDNTAYANVLLGNGDGSFSGPNACNIDSYAYANSALTVNLNGDVYDDFVTFDNNGYAAVLLGDANGYLQGPGYFYTGDYSYGVAVGDLNGDGDADLVTAIQGSVSGMAASSLILGSEQ